MTLKLQDFDHVHDRMKSLTAEPNSYKIEVESCQENIKREQTLRKSLEDQSQHQVNQYQELKKKMTEDMAQVYARVQESEENLEKVKSENDELRQNNSTLLKENEGILQRVEDLEKETNVMQENLFEGELVTRGDIQNPDRKSQYSQPPQEDANIQSTGQNEQTKKVFRDVKPVGDTIVFGDSNTRGLNRRRLAMGNGSLSGATLDSVIAYINNEPTPNEAVKRVIYHLGTNNIRDNTTDEIKTKLNTLKIKSADKFSNAKICFCEIPPNHHAPSPRITEVNGYIKSMDTAFLEVDAKDPGFFTRDGIHYNKQGLGRLAASMKKWARENGHSFDATSDHSKQRRFQEKPFLWNQQNRRKGRNSQWRNAGPAQQLINLLLTSLGKR